MKTMHRGVAYLGVSVMSSLLFAIAWLIVQTLSLPEIFLAHGLSRFHHPPFLLGLSILVVVCSIISWPFYTLLGWRLPPVKVGIITGTSVLTWIVVATRCNLWVGWPGSYLVLLLSLLVCRFMLRQERPTSSGALSRDREGSLVTFAHNLPIPRRILLLIFTFFVGGLSANEHAAASEEASKEIRLAITDSAMAKVYLGLPRQSLGRDESKRKDTVKIGSYRFYTPAVTTANPDVLKLILSSSDSIQVFRGEKRCGGFHPDYAVECIGENGHRFYAQICLGCHEIIYSDGKNEYRYDFEKEPFERLKKELAPYAKMSPHGKGLEN